MCNHDGNHGNDDTGWKLFIESCRLGGQESAPWKPWKQSVAIRGFQVQNDPEPIVLPFKLEQRLSDF